MTSKISVANRALTKLGANRITSFADNTKEARTVNNMFDVVRDDELRARAWSFSKKRIQLAADTDPPVFGYSFAYTLPVECLRIWEVEQTFWNGPDLADYRNDGYKPYVLEGRKILTSAVDRDAITGTPNELKLVYLAQISDTTLWDANYVESFACRLAAEMCEDLTQSTTRRQLAWEEYDQSIKKARRANAIELPPEYISDDSWVIARLRGA